MKVLVPTCNRPELFARLVSRLQGFEVIGFVNNSTVENVERYLSLELPRYARIILTAIKGEPKVCHVHTFRAMVGFVDEECIILEDDVYPSDNFYSELHERIRILKSVTSDFTLSPIYLPNRNSDHYTGGTSKEITLSGTRFIDQAWVDGNFYMTKNVLQSIQKWLSDKVKVYRASSGVGRLVSMKMYERGWKMYTAAPTLVEHLDHHSVMFGPRRQEIPLIARFDQK